MLKRTEGIVLKNRPHLDADLVVTYLTLDAGIINLYAKSSRKISSRFGSSLEPLTYAKIAFWGKEQSSLPRLTQSDIIKPFFSLRDSMNLFFKISEILELTLKLMPERKPKRSIFSLLLNTLACIEKNPENVLYTTYYKLRVLSIGGFAPMVGSCAKCGKDADRFYLNEGATMCNFCVIPDNNFIQVSPSVMSVYHYFMKVHPFTLERLKLSQDIRIGLEALINSHINYTVVSELKTSRFVRLMKN